MASPNVSRPATTLAPATADRRLGFLWLLVPAAFYYAALLTAGAPGPLAPVNLGLTFNSMLMHLLQGRFDVDPAAIGAEGYRHGDAVYAYFGIFPALMRAPLLWLPKFATTDLTRLACLVAVLAMAAAKLISVRLLWQQVGARAPSLLLTVMSAVILLGGPQIEFLRPSVYQEVELWAGAQQAAFVYLLLRGLYRDGGFSPRLLDAMALVAGLCLMTRVSNALGLYLALAFVGACVAWRRMRGSAAWRNLVPLLTSCAILGGFAAAAAGVNYARWGNPLVFADFSHALINELYPDRLALVERYGEFNPGRLGFGLSYYFAPLWGLKGAPYGSCAELPPGSFLVSDPLLLGLSAYGLVVALRRGAPRRGLVVAAGAGLLVPAGLMLTAFGMSFRYRMEFYAFFELFAFLGFARLASRPVARLAGWVPPIIAVGAAAEIIAAPAMWLLYMLSPFGPAESVLGGVGIAAFYRSLFP